MKLKLLADETDGFDKEGHELMDVPFYTKARTEELRDVLELVVGAAMQSGLRYRKTVIDEAEGFETVVLDASDAEPVVLQSIFTDLKGREAEYVFGTTEYDQDILTISYPIETGEEGEAEVEE